MLHATRNRGDGQNLGTEWHRHLKVASRRSRKGQQCHKQQRVALARDRSGGDSCTGKMMARIAERSVEIQVVDTGTRRPKTK